jgi:DNA-binding HxlR family transcriptional regulator
MRKLTSTNTINKQHLEEACGMAYTISVMGGRWKLSILGVLADFGKLRYKELEKHLVGISARMLVKQLNELQDHGLIVKNIFAQVPVRVEYELSDKGNSLKPLLTLMAAWGSKQLEKSK